MNISGFSHNPAAKVRTSCGGQNRPSLSHGRSTPKVTVTVGVSVDATVGLCDVQNVDAALGPGVGLIQVAHPTPRAVTVRRPSLKLNLKVSA